MSNNRDKCTKIKKLIKLISKKIDISISHTGKRTKNNFELSDFYTILNIQMPENKKTTKLNIKQWQTTHRHKIIQILNLLHDCYKRTIKQSHVNIVSTKLKQITAETKNLLIDTIISTHELGIDNGTYLNELLPVEPSTPLPSLPTSVKKPTPIQSKEEPIAIQITN